MNLIERYKNWKLKNQTKKQFMNMASELYDAHERLIELQNTYAKIEEVEGLAAIVRINIGKIMSVKP